MAKQADRMTDEQLSKQRLILHDQDSDQAIASLRISPY